MNYYELVQILEAEKIDCPSKSEQEMIIAIARHFSSKNFSDEENHHLKKQITATGVLYLFQDGFGFLRFADNNYFASPYDVYVSPKQCSSLRVGDTVECIAVPPRKNEKYFALKEILSVNGSVFQKTAIRNKFEKLTPIYPSKRINLFLENEQDLTLRIIDLVAPMGFGQRGLVVAPPKAGKTTILQKIAKAIETNHPEAYLMILLIDERPEEVTEMIRWTKGEVISSTFDEHPARHVSVAEIVVEKAKRLVECGKDVIILIDGITRLSRAYNAIAPSSGRVLTGGVDSAALQKPKRFFGAARNVENGGSLSIIATTLIETGSKMDEVIFEEFKGTGNMELVLDRKLQEKRMFPCVEINKSGTRKEELLIPVEELHKTRMLRKIISSMGPVEAMEFLADKMKHTKTNDEFFKLMNG